jgi:hypothetical protein
MSTDLLAISTTQQAIDHAKRCIEIAGKGGGYIMSNSAFFDEVKRDNLKAMVETVKKYGVTREEFHQFQEGTKELLRNFLEFFISYGLELGKQPGDNEFEQLAQKLQSLGSSAKVKSS